MNSNRFQELANAISAARLTRYRSNSNSDDEAIERYFWNIQVSEALLPSLALYEIALRNAAHSALTLKYETDDWFSRALRGGSLSELDERRKHVETQHGGAVSVDKLVSELMLGFWTFLLARKHHRIWWDPADSPDFAIARVVPHKPHVDRGTRSELHQRAMYFLVLRNRVGHHESVVDGIAPFGLPRLELPEIHSLLWETIAWISPTLHEHGAKIDRFPSVWRASVEKR